MPIYNNNIRVINTNNSCYNTQQQTNTTNNPTYLVTTELRTPKLETIYCSNNTNNYDIYSREIATTSTNNSIMLDGLNNYGKNMVNF